MESVIAFKRTPQLPITTTKQTALQFMQKFLSCFSFAGIIKRSALLRVLFGSFLLVFAAAWLDDEYIAEMRGFLPGEEGAGNPLALSVMALLAWPVLAAMVKRLRDHQRSPIWLLFLLPGLGIPYYLWTHQYELVEQISMFEGFPGFIDEFGQLRFWVILVLAIVLSGPLCWWFLTRSKRQT